MFWAFVGSIVGLLGLTLRIDDPRVFGVLACTQIGFITLALWLL